MIKLNDFIAQINNEPASVEFEDTISVIEHYYYYTPAEFFNGPLVNEAGINEGSCKIFAFAKQHNLDEQHTLHCFGKFYRVDVLKNLAGSDHLNIRQFMKTGWPGISFKSDVLSLK